MKREQTGRLLEYVGYLVIIVSLANWSLVASGVAVGVAVVAFGKDLRNRGDEAPRSE